ncbi:Universal stress protein family protein [Halobiforma haloterrestris]|uniref:Universal stress protein family protein n=1 Tax=Natronobacterium haloterrestre TaxID=148448 RepID=A0A1I1EA03_NATHA|nr:universal stress protein [Halobiforma haloterrestris]SFB81850.1 Universal stress protein family protein [Halobiforma haloterrestris]
MTPTPTIVVPIEVMAGPTVSDALAEFVAPLPVLVLGVVEIPDQTSSTQAREQFEEGASRTIETVAEGFAAAGADVDTRLSFTHDANETVERVVADLERAVVLFPAPATEIEDVVVAVRSDATVPAAASTVAALTQGDESAITVYHAALEDEGNDEIDRILSAVETALEDAGIDPDRLTRTVERADTPIDALVAAANDHDLLVVGETEPRLRDHILGETHERIATGAAAPVLVVRRPAVE